MTARNVGLCLAGLLVVGGLGCNEIAGIKAATEDPDAAGSCNPELTIGAERAVGCMFRIACDPFLPPYSMSECVSMAWQDAAPSETCTFGAESCADVEACTGRGYEPATSCDGTVGWTCDASGERAINCSDAGAYSIDCAFFGGTCLSHSSTTVPTAYACQTNSPPSCPDDAVDGDYYCEGTQRFTCIDGQPYGVDCAATSSECIEYGPGVAYCSDRTETCSDANTIACDGDAIEACDSSGYRVRFDCTNEGLVCEEDSETGDIECLAEGCETATGCTEECLSDGVTMRFCAGGVPFEIDCTDYGYDGCLEDETRQGEVPFAYCALATGAPPHD